MKKTLLALPLLMITTSHGAVTLLTDDFTYADGDLVGNGNWVTHSGTLGTMDVVGGAVSVTQNSGSEDAHTVFAPQTTGILTATFDITVTAPGAMTGTDFEYFAHFIADPSNSYRARLDLQAPNATGDYTIGISTLSTTADANLPVDFSFGVPVTVAMSFDFDAGTASVTAGSQTVSSAVVSLANTLDSFALRQSDSSSNETILVDNLVITASVPEPTTSLLGAIGLLALLRRRR